MAFFSLSVPGGSDIIKSIGFKAKTLLVDNYTNTWYYIQEVDYFIPPKWVGVIIPLDHLTDYLQIIVRNPFVQFNINTGAQATQFQIHVKATTQEFEYDPGRSFQDITNYGAVYFTQAAFGNGTAGNALTVSTSALTDIPVGGGLNRMFIKIPHIVLWRTSTATIAGTGQLSITFSRFLEGVTNFWNYGDAIAAGETQTIFEYHSDVRPLFCTIDQANNKLDVTIPAGGAGVINHGWFLYEIWYAV